MLHALLQNNIDDKSPLLVKPQPKTYPVRQLCYCVDPILRIPQGRVYPISGSDQWKYTMANFGFYKKPAVQDECIKQTINQFRNKMFNDRYLHRNEKENVFSMLIVLKVYNIYPYYLHMC